MKEQSLADSILEKALMAGGVFSQFDQKNTDEIVEAVCTAAFAQRVRLAKMAVDETGLGVWQDKVIKNVVASQLVYHNIKHEKTAGVISKNEVTGITKIAQPLGPILAIMPVTNPTSTVIFKILICLKARNPIIIYPHRHAIKCCAETAKICYEAALQAGAPDDCIQIISEPTHELSAELMHHKRLALILATGGPGLVNVAYSSGTPAIGVGPGNVPVLIEKTADIPFAISSILTSKTFDNGTICSSEQAIVVTKDIAAEVSREFTNQKGYMLNEEEVKSLEKVALSPETGLMNPKIVGQSAVKVAQFANIGVPEGTRVLVGRVHGVGKKYPLSREILAPVLAYFVCDTFDEAVKTCIDLNYQGGLGHTVSLYSNDEDVISNVATIMDAGRFVVNTPSSQGAIGGIFNMLAPSLTLGCGAGGKNITMENVSAKHLINVKKICRRRDNDRFLGLDRKLYLDESLGLEELEAAFNKNH